MPIHGRGNVRIHYEEAGSGPALMVIPGGGLTSTMGFLAMDSAMLALCSEVSLYPWKDKKEHVPLAVRHVRSFLHAHQQWPRC